MARIFHLVGYKQTGKDAFVKTLQKKNNFIYRIYTPKYKKIRFPTKKIVRLAFADELKHVVCKRLKLPVAWVKDGTFDQYKDNLPDDIDTGLYLKMKGKPLRYFCKKISLELKQKYGKKYFVDCVRNKILSKIKKQNNVFITDTRYPYEVFPGAVTIRIFRSKVLIPDFEDESEHSMDNYECDVLVCETEEDFNIFKKHSKLYKNFIFRGFLSENLLIN